MNVIDTNQHGERAKKAVARMRELGIDFTAESEQTAVDFLTGIFIAYAINEQPRKQTSPYLSTMAARYMAMTDEQMDEAAKNRLAFYRNIRSMAASVVSQDETKGQ